MKKGLVLEGGAMRGMFTAGVCDVLMENNVEFDGIVGVSAGAAFGCNYKSGQVGRAIRYNMKYCRDKRYCSFHSLIKTGDLYGAEFCYKILPNEYDIFDEKTFFENPTEFYAVCTDVVSGKPLYHRFDKKEEDYFEWFRASASMPLVSNIVEVGGYRLLDGGMSDSIPIKFFENIGYDKNVIVMTQPKGYVKNKNRLMPLIRHALKDYPKLIDVMANRHNMYNEQVRYAEKLEKEGKAILIRPFEKLPVSRTDKNPENLKKAYEMGRQQANEQLNSIKEFLKGV